MVDVDEWDKAEFAELLKWADSDPRHYLVVSNPKFELFLVMHFEKGNGCTTAPKVDQTLKRYLPRYDKRLAPTAFSRDVWPDPLSRDVVEIKGCLSIAGRTLVLQTFP